jgi:hypothetical protein
MAQHPWIVPIPGTTKSQRLQENTGAVDVELSHENLKEIAEAADHVGVHEPRLRRRSATVRAEMKPAACPGDQRIRRGSFTGADADESDERLPLEATRRAPLS